MIRIRGPSSSASSLLQVPFKYASSLVQVPRPGGFYKNTPLAGWREISGRMAANGETNRCRREHGGNA